VPLFNNPTVVRVTKCKQAGLFSAVLTAFVVESYSSLNEDSAAITINALTQISMQLSNSSAPAFSPDQHFTPAPTDVRVNILWFLGLVLSLTAALFGFLMKQWLREYVSWFEISLHKDAVSVRQFRYDGLLRWQLHGICAGLPVLLQVSLGSFLIGLIDFLLHLPSLVGPVVASAVVSCLFAVAITIALPTIAASCPFRSPLSRFFRQCIIRGLLQMKPLYNALQNKLEHWCSIEHRDIPTADVTWRLGWTGLDLQLDLDFSWSTSAVYHIWAVSQNALVLMKVTPCLYSLSMSSSTPRQTVEVEVGVDLHASWPILTALAGSVDPHALLDTGVLSKCTTSLPFTVSQELAGLLLNSAEHTLREGWFSDIDIDGKVTLIVVHILPSILGRESGSTRLARFFVVLCLWGRKNTQSLTDLLSNSPLSHMIYSLSEWGEQEYESKGDLGASEIAISLT
jgi:hypothetical protein